MCAVFCSNDNASASCYDANGYISINSSIYSDLTLRDIGNFKTTGGDPFGSGGWACSGNSYAIMFVANSVAQNGEYYTINIDINVNLDSEYNQAIAMGMVHYFSYGSRNRDTYAVNIGYCIKKNGCGKGGTADGIITNYSSVVQRTGKNVNPALEKYSYWTAPAYHYSTININGKKLKEKIENDANFRANNIVKEIEGGKGYVIKLYQYRCWSSTGYSTNNSCSANVILLLVRNTTKPPDPTPTPDTPNLTCGSHNKGSTGISKNGGYFSFTGSDPDRSFSWNSDFNSYASLTSIWAKPGDSIRYSHKICAGAQNAVDRFSELRSGYSASYDFSARTTYDGETTKYLFGDTLGRKTTITASDLHNYELTVNSPSDSASSKYNCLAMSGSGLSIAGYYRIPSLTSTNNCQSAAYTRLSDVGNTITQTMSWRDLKIDIVERCSWSWDDEDGWTRDCWDEPEIDGMHNGSRTYTSAASVYIPYNYTIKPYIVNSNESSSIVTLGSSINVGIYLPVDKRENKQVGATYATQTKPTKVRVVSYVANSSNIPTAEVSYYVDATGVGTNLCSKIKGNERDSTVANTCRTEDESRDGLILNKNSTGNLDGTYYSSKFEDTNVEDGGSHYKTIEATIPDAGDSGNYNIGDHFCVAVATWPSDSHNIGAASSVNTLNQQIALTNDAGAGAQWSISAPTCVTIAKNPTFSVEGSQLLTTGNVSSAVFNRSKNHYSSWSEYGIIAAGAVSNMASGAATAYINALGLNSTDDPNYATGSKDVNRASTSSGAYISSRIFNSQTMLNNVLGGRPGNATNLDIDEDIHDFYEAITGVYTRKNSTDKTLPGAGIDKLNNLLYTRDLYTNRERYIKQTKRTSDGKTATYYDITPRNAYACEYSEDLGYYLPNPDDAQRGVTITGNRTAPFYCLTNGAEYYYVEGDAYLGLQSDSTSNQYINFVDDLTGDSYKDTYRNQTTVMHVTGKLTIDINLIIDSNHMVTYGRRYENHIVDYFTDIQQIPQLILIADSFDITANVTRIDAWLIADVASDDEKSGTINTCAYDNFSGFYNSQYINYAGKNSALTANKCSRELLINGPVVARNLILNRTAGAGTQPTRYDSSATSLKANNAYYVQRGEIFNLRPDAYLWGYYQAQRNGIVTTVYSHEYSTRY